MRYHDVRHTAATLMLPQGVNGRTIMEISGHSQISLTLNTYSHVVPALKHNAADRMDDSLRDAADAKAFVATELLHSDDTRPEI
jgi:integrase